MDINSPKLQSKTIMMLIDFHGHPILGDDHTNNQRYSKLAEMICNPFYDLVIVSTHNKEKHSKMEEYKKMVDIEERHTWIVIDPDKKPTPTDIAELCKEKGFKIGNVIMGGTNTAGCIIRSRSFSAAKWAQAGYEVQIWLPLCAENQLTGVNQLEREQKAFSIVYREIKKERLWNKIDIVDNIAHLKLVKNTVEKKIDIDYCERHGVLDCSMCNEIGPARYSDQAWRRKNGDE